MTSGVFLAAFLGCLFALGIVALATVQYLAWKARKHVGTMAEWLEGAADGDPALRAQLEMASRRGRRPQAASSFWGVRCSRVGCERMQSIPTELKIGPESEAWLASIGWSITVQGSPPTQRIICPFCANEEIKATAMAAAETAEKATPKAQTMIVDHEDLL